MLAEILIFVPIVLNLIYVFIAAKHPNLLVMNSPAVRGCSPSSDCSVSDVVKVIWCFRFSSSDERIRYEDFLSFFM